MGGRRAARQDARRRRPRPRRHARRPAGAGVRDAARRLRPVRVAPSGPGSWASSCSTLDELVARGRLPHDPPAEDARDDRADRRATCWRKAKPGLRIINTARGGIVDEAALADAIRDGHVGGRRARRVRRASRRTSRRCSSSTRSSSRPHLGRQHRARRRTRRATPSPSRCVLALAGDFVPFAVNVDARRGVRDGAPVPPAGRAARAGCSPSLDERRCRPSLEIEYQGELADYDTRILTLSVLKGLLGAGQRGAGVVRERAAAGRGARHRGARDDDHRTAHDYVNLITVRGGEHALGRHARRACGASRAS